MRPSARWLTVAALTPIVVSLKDLPIVFEEAAECLGASRLQTFRRVVIPLIGPGVSAGLMLTFIIVFNEYLVTLFVHPTNITTAPLRIFNVIRTAGLLPTTAALAPCSISTPIPDAICRSGYPILKSRHRKAEPRRGSTCGARQPSSRCPRELGLNRKFALEIMARRRSVA